MTTSCKKCVMDNSDPLLRLNDDGICQYCIMQEQLEEQYPLDDTGHEAFLAAIEQIKRVGRNRKYDCIIGVSGGTDSTYQLHLAKQHGLRVLAVHFDNGWNSDIAVKNIEKVTRKLGFELTTYVVDWQEFRDLQLSFLKASTPDSEIPTDLAIQKILYKTASDEGVKYVMNGHSFRTEGKVPIMWSYGDGKYLQAVHKKFGSVPLKTFPNYTLTDLFYYSYIKGIKQFRFLYYVPYDKESTKRFLTEEYGWEDYGGHHYESVYTRFYQGYILPRKFGIDKRKREFSALIRSGQITRDEAMARLTSEPPMPEDQAERDRAYLLKKFEMEEKEFERIMNLPHKSFLDYTNYYSIIKRFRKPISILYRMVSPTTPLLIEEMNANIEHSKAA